MTPLQKQCLLYLSDKMEANTKMMLEHLEIKEHGLRKAAKMLEELYNQGLVTRITDLNAWRITKKGREVL